MKGCCTVAFVLHVCLPEVLNVDNTIGENMIQKKNNEFYNLHILSRGTKIVYAKVTKVAKGKDRENSYKATVSHADNVLHIK